jgi:hypothetical protein
MSQKAERLLERMKQTQAGWHPHDFHTLYLGFGFIMVRKSKHDIFFHPDFPQLRDTIPRHGELAKPYTKAAVENIEKLKALQKERDKSK